MQDYRTMDLPELQQQLREVEAKIGLYNMLDEDNEKAKQECRLCDLQKAAIQKAIRTKVVNQSIKEKLTALSFMMYLKKLFHE